MKDNNLTPRQQEIYDIIERECRNGLPPTIREIMAETGIRSPNGIVCHLRALAKKGRIEIDEMKSRGIRLIATEIEVTRTGEYVFVRTAGPVAMTSTQWDSWLKQQIAAR